MKKKKGFAKNNTFSQEDMQVLPRDKNLAKKGYKFCKKRKFQPKIYINFA